MTENPYDSPLAPVSSPQRLPYGLQVAAIALLVIAFIELTFSGLSILVVSYSLAENPSKPAVGGPFFWDGVTSVIVNLVFCARTVTVIFGAIWIRFKVQYRFALAGAIASLLGIVFLPIFIGAAFGTHGFAAILVLLNAPFGAWALFALLRTDTRIAFTYPGLCQS